jgi:hypothetical protein
MKTKPGLERSMQEKQIRAALDDAAMRIRKFAWRIVEH